MPTLPLIALGVITIAAILAPWLTSYGPTEPNLPESLMPPAWTHEGTAAHLLGTDTFGRDIFTRLLYGARVSLGLAVSALAVATLLGTVIGVLSGYLGGWVDSVLMRFVDMILSLPVILVAMAIAVAAGPSFYILVSVIGFLLWPRIARLVRGDTLALKQQEFVRYARAIGVPAWLIVLRHVLPNVLHTLLVAVTLEVGHVILLEAGLSFLGAGMPPPQASWGVMIADGSGLVATGWWISLFAGFAILITILCTNALGNWLQDHYDPKHMAR